MGNVAQTAPRGGLRLDLLLQQRGNVCVGASPLDQIRAGARQLGLRLVVFGAAQHRQAELPLAVAPAHQQPHADGLRGHGQRFFAQDFYNFFQCQVLGVVGVQRVDDLHRRQRIARKAHRHIAVDLAHLGQIVLEDVGLVVRDGFLDKASVADHRAERIAAYG